MSNIIRGTPGNDALTGTSGGDLFDLSQGGADSVSGLGGNDVFRMGAALTGADRLDGGAGNDTVQIAGDYTGDDALAFQATTLTSVETLRLGAGFDYAITGNDATVAAGRLFTVDASALGPANMLIFDGAAETDGRLRLIGGAGDDILTGGARNDTFVLSHGGDDIANGGAGNDVFDIEGTLSAGDQLNGGLGDNAVVLDGMGGADAITFSATNFTQIQTLVLRGGADYALTTVDANIAAGTRLTVNATALAGSDTLAFDGSAETNGRFTFETGGGTFSLTAGSKEDVFSLGAAFNDADAIDGGPGIDHAVLDGDYTGVHALHLSANAMRNIQVVALRGGHSYDITADDGAFGPAQVLPTTLTCYDFQAGDNLTFDDSAETGLQDRLFATLGTYNVRFGAANDFFAFGANFAASDTLDGGGGNDILALNAIFLHPDANGDYTGANALGIGANQLISVEQLGLTGGYSYDITVSDGSVPVGGTLTIQADGFSAYAGGGDTIIQPALRSGDALTFNGAAETGGHFVFNCAGGTYTLTGGSLSDTFNFRAMQSGAAYTIDAFAFGTGATHDTIQFHAVTAIDAAVTAGALSAASFATDLAAAIGAGQLGAHHAVLFTADAGDAAGRTFLIVDGNGIAGYQAGADIAIALNNATGTMETADFSN
jgi:hypothetical protein